MAIWAVMSALASPPRSCHWMVTTHSPAAQFYASATGVAQHLLDLRGPCGEIDSCQRAAAGTRAASHGHVYAPAIAWARSAAMRSARELARITAALRS